MDLTTFAYLCIILVRLVGFLVLLDSYRNSRDRILLWLCFGWLIYAGSPLFGLLKTFNPLPIYNYLYLSLALFGVYFLTSGAIRLFKPFSMTAVTMGAAGLFLLFSFGFFLSNDKFIGIVVPLLQFIILTVVTIVAMIKRDQYQKIAGNSINWLLAIFLIGIPQALAYVVLQPTQIPAVSLLLTNFTSMLIAVYFVQLQHNISQVQLKESENRYKLLVENQTDFIVKISPKGDYLYVNPKFCEIFGKSPDELMRMNLFSFIHPDDVKTFQETLPVLSEPPFTRQIELRAQTINGWRWIAWSENAVLDSENKVISITASGRDIEDQKAAEKKILELNADLEQRVNRRTAQLNSLNKELKTFTYSVTHDLKAPLRHIEGYSQILLEDYAKNLDDTGVSYIERIIRAVEKMRRLIDGLLAYTKLDTLPWAPHKLSINTLVEKMLNDYAIEIHQNQIQIVLNLQESIVLVDEEGLLQVLGNLLDNAIKYSKKQKEPIIEIGSQKLEDKTLIWVKDNGVGFDMDFHDKIFEIFQRLHTESEFPGTGIGLAIAHKAAQRMRGKLWAESASGKGATFFLEIPDSPS